MIMRRRILLVVTAVISATAAFAATSAIRGAAGSASPAAATSRPAGGIEPLLRWLNVPEAQRRRVAEHDPSFAADVRRLREEVDARRAELAAVLENADSPDELVIQRVEAAIAAKNALERRVARYLITIRQHLTSEQRHRLLSLCAECVRESCMCWRSGRAASPESAPGRHGKGWQR